MARRHNAQAIKIHRNYTVDDAARALGVSKGTIRRWLKDGLPAITDQKPLLILGADLIDYLNNRTALKRKCRLHECFCFSCQEPRAPAFGAIEIVSLTATSGNMRALCVVCSTVMHKRVSLAKLELLKAILDVTIVQDETRLNDSGFPSLNEHFGKDVKTHA